MERGVCDLKKILGIDLLDPDLQTSTVAVLNTVIAKLKENSAFINLGTCFHRNKINLEKCIESYTRLYEIHQSAGFLKYCDTPEKMTKRELRAVSVRTEWLSDIKTIDRITIDQQTAFYHWIKETLERAVDYIKRAYKSSGALPTLDDEGLIALSTRVPEFMEWPIYKSLVP